MPSTYLQLTNKLLRRLNETELTSDNFDSVRGVHALCKDAVSDAVSRINTFCHEWPFNAYQHTQTLIAGTSEYGWPDNYKQVDWNSFQIQKDDSLDVRHKHLRKINRDEWYRDYKDRDDDAGSDGVDVPIYVFEAHGTGFGITPVPDEAYTLVYRYYITPTVMTDYDDTTTIPGEWEWVITDGALAIGNLFKEDSEGHQLSKQDFEKSLKFMRSILVNKTENMEDSMIPRPYRYNSGRYLPI